MLQKEGASLQTRRAIRQREDAVHQRGDAMLQKGDAILPIMSVTCLQPGTNFGLVVLGRLEEPVECQVEREARP
jgi:hypothetical protein